LPSKLGKNTRLTARELKHTSDIFFQRLRKPLLRLFYMSRFFLYLPQIHTTGDLGKTI